MDLVKVLNDLISTLFDSEEAFDKAANGAHSADLRRTFDALSLKRAAFADELAGHVKNLGGEPVGMGRGGGPLSRGWSDLEQRIRPKDDAAFLANCERGEETALKHFDRALAQDLPTDIRTAAEAQRRSIRETVDQLRRTERLKRAS